MGSKSAISVVMVCFFATILFSSMIIVNAVPEETDNPCSGPYVDKVIYREINDPDEQILALQAHDIDSIINPFDPLHLDTLQMDPDIMVQSQPSHGLKEILIDCRVYPLNMSGFRRAFAFAFDKNQFVSEVMDGHALVHDSLLLKQDSLCAEEDLPWHYYASQPDMGNDILNALNFTIDPVTEFRLAPDGTPFDIQVYYAFEDGGADVIAQRAVDALGLLQIDAESVAVGFNTLYANIGNHVEFEMAVYKEYRNRIRDSDWILDEFYSQNADIYYMNPSNYMNDTFDILRDYVLDASTYEAYVEAMKELQINLHENVPILIVYQEIDYQAYGITDFTGHVEDNYWGIIGPWTNLKVHKKIGSAFGGTFEIGNWATRTNPFNIFLPSFKVESIITNNLYSSLCKIGPDQIVYPNLAEEVVVETNLTNSSVPEGQTWITVRIKDDVKWSDGEHLDAEDIANTFTFLSEASTYNNLENRRWVDNFLSSQVLSSRTVRLILNRNSFHNIQTILLTKIIPEHIFNDATGIGHEDIFFWEPVITGDPHVTSGPFFLSQYSATIIELSRNMDYHWKSGLAPKILSADDVTYVQGTTGNQIVWNVTDEDPLDYTIFQDGSLLVTEEWDGSSIVRNIDGLGSGSYNFTLVLTDNSEYRVTNTVWVIVIPAEDMPDILIIGVIMGSTIIILGSGVAILKKRS